jgi:hypothetical protein
VKKVGGGIYVGVTLNRNNSLKHNTEEQMLFFFSCGTGL